MSTEATTSTERARRNRPAEFTERDAAALAWLGEQYGARFDVLSVLLGRLGGRGPLSRWGVRNQLQRWTDAGLVTTDRVLGDLWVTPTRKGLDRSGSAFNTWAIPSSRVRHCHAVNVVRLWWEQNPASEQCPWISERITYRERGSAKWHIPDGVIRDPRTPAGQPWQYIGLEIELTHKGRRAYDEEVFGNLRAGIAAMSYFVPNDAFAQRLGTDVRSVLDQRGSTTRFTVQTLPEVAGVSYKLER